MSQEPNYPRLVLDASVAVKWFLNDEDLVIESRRIYELYSNNSIALLAPDQIRYEVASAIRNAERRGRAAADIGRRDINNFLNLQIPTVHSGSLIRAGYDYSLSYNCALYDALYLALADMAQCPLVHADRRLHNTLGGRFERELWIADYAPAEE